jgi:hypothetical protein
MVSSVPKILPKLGNTRSKSPWIPEEETTSDDGAAMEKGKEAQPAKVGKLGEA